MKEAPRPNPEKSKKTSGQIAPDIHERIQNLHLMDDDFMRIFLADNKEATELVVRTIIGKDDIEVVEVVARSSVDDIGRSVQLDILAKDSQGALYNIEIQRNKDGASPKRLRYHSSILDATALERDEDFTKLPEKYVIFITEDDYWKKGKPFYRFANMLVDDDLKLCLNDGQHYIYVNGAYVDNTPLGKLMQDFRQKNPAKMGYELLKD